MSQNILKIPVINDVINIRWLTWFRIGVTRSSLRSMMTTRPDSLRPECPTNSDSSSPENSLCKIAANSSQRLELFMKENCGLRNHSIIFFNNRDLLPIFLLEKLLCCLKVSVYFLNILGTSLHSLPYVLSYIMYNYFQLFDCYIGMHFIILVAKNCFFNHYSVYLVYRAVLADF